MIWLYSACYEENFILLLLASIYEKEFWSFFKFMVFNGVLENFFDGYFLEVIDLLIFVGSDLLTFDAPIDI